MKKASKILTLILVFVLLAGIFSGCAMFTRNAGKYRSLVAVNVGNEEITVGKILDTFNNYYNTYGNYIGQGITVEYLLQMTMQSLVTQAMKVDAYISSNPAATDNTGDLKDYCHNAQYLTKEEIEYCVTYVKYLTFQSFDSSVLSQLSANRTFADEEEEDTSRDFTELVDLEGRVYSEYNYRQRVFGEAAQEYFDKYYGSVEIKLDKDVSEYVYKDAAAAKAMLDSLNERKDEEDDEVTFEEYRTAQEKVVKQYQRTIKNTYGLTFEQFMVSQVADMVQSVIVAKYDYSINKDIDTTNLDATLQQLKDNLTINRNSQKAGFALNDNFVEFIEGLSSSSYIYDVPDKFKRVNTDTEQSGYIFVKNILIPFTDQQKTTLSNLSKDLGGDTTKQAYIDLRNQFAKDIIADDFNSTKKDGKYDQVGGLFDIVDGKLVVKADNDNPLNTIFKDGKVVIEGTDYATKDEAVIDYMKRFNTDTAQHTAQYDYVVRVGEVPSDYTAKWVPEFVDAANEAAKGGVGSYALAISTYGVHIVYYSADVEAQGINFNSETINNTSLPEYRLFSAYFSQQSSRLVTEKVEALQKSYLADNKISTNNNFKRFLKDNGFEFDLIKALSEED